MPDPLSELQRLGQEFDADVVEAVAVTLEARDIRAAEDWARKWKNCAGEMTALYEYFARHRIAAIEAARSMIEKEAFEKAAKVAEAHADGCAQARGNAGAMHDRHGVWQAEAERLASLSIATAIRALGDRVG